jgi:hypothetical protein
MPTPIRTTLEVAETCIYGTAIPSSQQLPRVMLEHIEQLIDKVVYNFASYTILRTDRRCRAESVSAAADSLIEATWWQSGLRLSNNLLQDVHHRYQNIDVPFNHPVKLHALCMCMRQPRCCFLS